MSFDRFFAHFSHNRASVAMEIVPSSGEQKELRFAVAFCNHRDQFNRNIARNVLNGRLNAAKDGSPVRLVFTNDYFGEHPKRDIMNPIMDRFRDLPEDREHQEVQAFLADVFLDFGGDNRNKFKPKDLVVDSPVGV